MCGVSERYRIVPYKDIAVENVHRKKLKIIQTAALNVLRGITAPLLQNLNALRLMLHKRKELL